MKIAYFVYILQSKLALGANGASSASAASPVDQECACGTGSVPFQVVAMETPMTSRRVSSGNVQTVSEPFRVIMAEQSVLGPASHLAPSVKPMPCRL